MGSRVRDPVLACCIGLAGLLPVIGAAFAADPPVAASADTVRDFMIQNVCLDPAGRAMPGRSPADPGAACAAQRDLRVGEALPYHKHDHPSPGERAGAPLGYQRHDSFPVATAGFGPVVEHDFDFGAGEGRRFSVFDAGSDGGDIAIVSPGAVSIGATRDAAGVTLWVGECDGALTAAALTHSWLVATFDPNGGAPLQGHTVARLNGVHPERQDRCPSRFNAAYTSWRVAPFRYRAAPGQGTPITLTTLISDHYGGEDPATADHVERFYFTRELGGSRWERWQNAKGNKQFSAATLEERAAWLAHNGRCSAPEPPAGGARMLMIDCREWTRIVPPAAAGGDAPGFFIKAIRARPEAPTFFAAPPAHK